jgi:hypothetical protein
VRIRVWREGASVERGFALIALLALAALIASFLIASGLNLTSAGNSNEREDRSMIALRKAKAALIAYAANEQWQLYKGQATNQPGALPCPDILLDDGNADCVGAGILANTSLVGRVPWQSIGIEDLRDASGERLWYALSYNFRKDFGTTVINSDTPGQLSVTGTAPANNVVAVLFAPGAALSTQNRPSDPTDPAHNSPSNYLESFNLADPVNYVFTSNTPSSDTFNDRVLVITQAELMAAVEPVVAARIERTVKPFLQNYFTKWGAFPFAAPFNGPDPGRAQSEYKGTGGVAGLTNGLLPLTNDPNWFSWISATAAQIVGHPMQTGTPPPTVTSSSCSIGSSPPQAVCQVNYCCGSDARPVIRLDIVLQNWNTAFADFPSPFANPISVVTMAANPGGYVQNDKYGYWSYTLPNFPPLPPSFVAQGTGNAVLTYIGRLQNADQTQGGVSITVPLPTPSYLPIVSGDSVANPSGAWFISNQWYRQTYYAVSRGFVPGGGGSCSQPPATPPPPLCLTINNLLPTNNNKQAILVFAGRALDGQTHPSPNPKNYLEGENCNLTAGKDLDIGSSPSTCNLTTSDYVYEHRAGTATTINDRVVVVSP